MTDEEYFDFLEQFLKMFPSIESDRETIEIDPKLAKL